MLYYYKLISLSVCDDCNREYEGDCPVHGPLVIIEDSEVKHRSISENIIFRIGPGFSKVRSC